MNSVAIFYPTAVTSLPENYQRWYASAITKVRFWKGVVFARTKKLRGAVANTIKSKRARRTEKEKTKFTNSGKTSSNPATPTEPKTESSPKPTATTPTPKTPKRRKSPRRKKQTTTLESLSPTQNQSQNPLEPIEPDPEPEAPALTPEQQIAAINRIVVSELVNYQKAVQFVLQQHKIPEWLAKQMLMEALTIIEEERKKRTV